MKSTQKLFPEGTSLFFFLLHCILLIFFVIHCQLEGVWFPVLTMPCAFPRREIALEVLSQEPVGAFMVRESTTKHGCYALSLRVPRDFQVSGIAHYLILKTAKGYKIKVRFVNLLFGEVFA